MKTFIATFAALFILTSCEKEVIRGSGSTSSKEVDVAAFTGVVTHADISADIIYGTKQKLVLTGYDNLLAKVTTTVINGALHIEYDPRSLFVRNGNVKAIITVPVLKKAAIHGSGDINTRNFSYADTFNGAIHGSGSINFDNCNYSGAKLAIYGSGSINGRNLQTTQASVSIHGSGSINISVSNKLEVGVYGSGNIYYWGNPQVISTIQGSGLIVKR